MRNLDLAHFLVFASAGSSAFAWHDMKLTEHGYEHLPTSRLHRLDRLDYHFCRFPRRFGQTLLRQIHLRLQRWSFQGLVRIGPIAEAKTAIQGKACGSQGCSEGCNCDYSSSHTPGNCPALTDVTAPWTATAATPSNGIPDEWLAQRQ